MMADTAGLLLLDVDGPLNPFAAPAHRRPEGYRTFRLTSAGTWLSGRDARRRKGMRVWLNPSHGPELLALAADTGLELVWCTTWSHEANTRIGPAIGLPPLPVVEFPATDLAADGSGWLQTGSWKWDAVARYAAGRPVAWLDDDHDDLHFAPARAAFESARAGTSTLLCHCDPRTGLLPEHRNQVRTWAATLTNPANPA
jgi:hypothetical protein